MKFFQSKDYLGILLIVCLVSLVITLTPVVYGIFPITFDQGRDFLWVKNQVDFHRPYLVGPWGSLAGVFFGPLWFWLLAIPYFLSQGNPLIMTLFNALIVFGSVFIAAKMLIKVSPPLAYFFVLICFLSPGILGISVYAFSQHLLPLLTWLLIYSYVQILRKSSRAHFILSLLWISLMFHAEPPVSVFSLPSLIIITLMAQKRKKFISLSTIALGLIAFVVPFIPQILFELRHDFIEVKSVLSFFSGKNRSLEGIIPIPIWKRIIDRPLEFFQVFRLSLLQKPIPVALGIMAVILYFGIKVKKDQYLSYLWQTSFIYTISLLLIFILFPFDLKSFYLDGLIIIFILWGAMFLTHYWLKKKFQALIGLFLLIAFWANLSPLNFISSFNQAFFDRYGGGSLYVNQKRTIDWIYQHAQGKGFKVYTFVGPTYDFNYQYLFFWYGLKQYGYLPAEFSYLPNKPEYIDKKSLQLENLKDKIRPADNEVYLIMEREAANDQRESWRQKFPPQEYILSGRIELPGRISVEKRFIRQ